MKRRLNAAYKDFLSRLIDEKQMDQRLQSYLGILSHANQFKLAQAAKNASWIREK